MDDAQKKDVSALAGNDTSSTSDNIIPFDEGKVKTQTKKNNTRVQKNEGKRRKAKPVKVSLECNSTRNVALKFYEEQLTKPAVEDLRKCIENLNGQGWEIIAVNHNNCEKYKDPWDVDKVKSHYHLIARRANLKPFRMSTLMNIIPVKYRKGVDDSLLENQGCETIVDFPLYIKYLLHQNKKAVLEGKRRYEMPDLMMSISEKRCRDLLLLCKELDEELHELTQNERNDYCNQARVLAENRGNYDEFLDKLPNFALMDAPLMRGIRTRYELAVRSWENRYVMRKNIYIKGPKNTGKTHSAELVGERMGLRIYKPNDGTGGFDRLPLSTDMLILNDLGLKDPLSMSDDAVCFAYRRNNNDRPWTGEYVVVTANIPFETWAKEKCNIKDSEEIEALKSRFVITELTDDLLGEKTVYEYFEASETYSDYIELDEELSEEECRERNLIFTNKKIKQIRSNIFSIKEISTDNLRGLPDVKKQKADAIRNFLRQLNDEMVQYQKACLDETSTDAEGQEGSIENEVIG